MNNQPYNHPASPPPPGYPPHYNPYAPNGAPPAGSPYLPPSPVQSSISPFIILIPVVLLGVVLITVSSFYLHHPIRHTHHDAHPRESIPTTSHITPSHTFPSHSSVPPSTQAPDLHSVGEHCALDRVIVAEGTIDCTVAEHLVARYSRGAHPPYYKGFHCTYAAQSPENFYQFWCQHGGNSFLGTDTAQAYQNVPTFFHHWIPDISPYRRTSGGGIDFLATQFAQCVILTSPSSLLTCASTEVPGTTQYGSEQVPNNTINFPLHQIPRPGFNQSAIFTFGRNARVVPGHTIAYGHYACFVGTNSLSCVNAFDAPHAFDLMPPKKLNTR